MNHQSMWIACHVLSRMSSPPAANFETRESVVLFDSRPLSSAKFVQPFRLAVFSDSSAAMKTVDAFLLKLN